MTKTSCITCETLLTPLSIVDGIIENTSPHPITGNVYISQSSTDLTFVATNLSIQIKVHCPLPEGEQPEFEFTVNAKKLHTILGFFKKQDQLQLTVESDRVFVSCDNSQYTLLSLPTKLFPKIPASEWKYKLVLPAKQLRLLFNLTSIAIPTTLKHYYLNGVNIERTENRLLAVATDTHRLAYYEINMLDKEEVKPFSSIIPRRTVQELCRLLPDEDIPVECLFNDTQCCFKYKNVEFMSKLTEGKFPNYASVLNAARSNPYDIELNRDLLFNSLRRVAFLTTDKLPGVRWAFTTNKLALQCTSSDSEEAQTILDVNWPHHESEMGFNVNYLYDVLKTITSPTVKLNFGNLAGAVKLTSPELPSFRYILMPMRI